MKTQNRMSTYSIEWIDCLDSGPNVYLFIYLELLHNEAFRYGTNEAQYFRKAINFYCLFHIAIFPIFSFEVWNRQIFRQRNQSRWIKYNENDVSCGGHKMVSVLKLACFLSRCIQSSFVCVNWAGWYHSEQKGKKHCVQLDFAHFKIER